jgi:hypothetical protein
MTPMPEVGDDLGGQGALADAADAVQEDPGALAAQGPPDEVRGDGRRSRRPCGRQRPDEPGLQGAVTSSMPSPGSNRGTEGPRMNRAGVAHSLKGGQASLA